MNKVSSTLSALAFSATLALPTQAKYTPEGHQQNQETQQASVDHKLHCRVQWKHMAEVLVPIVVEQFNASLRKKKIVSSIHIDIEPVYPDAAWNQFVEIVRMNGEVYSSSEVTIIAEKPISKFSFVMNNVGQYTHNIQCLK